MLEDVLFGILYGLLIAARALWKEESPDSFGDMIQYLSLRCDVVTDWGDQDTVKERFWQVVTSEPNRIDFSKGRKFLLPLPPIEKESHLLPFLYMKAENAGNEWCWRLYVLLFVLAANGGEPQGVAIRFESPEKCFDSSEQDNLGAHDFFHAQFCQAVDGIRLNSPSWMPENQPSFFLKAKGDKEFDLFFNMIVSLYSWKQAPKLTREYLTSQLKKSQLDFLRAHVNQDLLGTIEI